MRSGLVVVCATLLLGLAAPYVNAVAFRTPIEDALHDALGRRVEIETVHFSLFTGPGFTLENVTIDEDPHYGLEPFAYIPTLQVRVRLDKLLLGQIRLLGLRMVDASLNLVKSDDGTWNAVTLVERLGAPRRTPLNFFPAVQISNGRVDFKLGTRKTTLYITETDLSIYPQTSGKIYFRFEGSPARTDRAGNGFGHLTGTANWYLTPANAAANQLEADVNLQPSNLSELATLFEGRDLGVHGTVSAHVLISGPFSDLHARGDLQLQDVHRWDLLPSPGDTLRVPFQANVDLREHTLELATVRQGPAESPMSLQLRASNFMTTPSWSVLANMRRAPLATLLPLGRRMGLALPAGLQMRGVLDGVVGYSSSAGLEGGVVITNAVANIPNVPPLRAALANVTISAGNVHIEPAVLQSDAGGTLRAGGDFDTVRQEMEADISADDVTAIALKETTNAWFGTPDALAFITAGKVSGHFRVSYAAGSRQEKPAWSGQYLLTDAMLSVPGAASPISKVQAKATFDPATFEMANVSGIVGSLPFTASYKYSVAAERPERLRLEFAEADLSQIETELAPALSDDSLLSRLPFTRRSIPAWLANRNLEGDIFVDRLHANNALTGRSSAHFIWQGTAVQLASFQLGLPSGKVQGSGTISLVARLPRYRFAMKLTGYPWAGGVLDADAQLDTSGMGPLALLHLQATGTFAAEDVELPGSDAFSAASGQFEFAFNGDTPTLKLTKVEAHQNDEAWSGEGAFGADGKLHLDLNNGERQLHLMSELSLDKPPQP